ncbi:MAG: hypothetical protein JWM11_5246 [Planctomycetaceae bacterium]|nr:hypothetical protein [Planctomycetaceae bacterium]
MLALPTCPPFNWPRSPGQNFALEPLRQLPEHPLNSRSSRRGFSLAEFVLVLVIVSATIGAGWIWHEWLLENPQSTSGSARDTGEHPALYAVAISPDQKHILSVGLGGVLRTHHFETRECIDQFETSYRDSRCMTYSPDGRYLLIGTTLGYFQIWDFQSEEKSPRGKRGHENEIICCAFDPSGESFVTCGRDGKFCVWSSATLQPISMIQCPTGVIHAVSFSHDGQRVVTGDMQGYVTAWNPHTGTMISSCRVSNVEDFEDRIIIGLKCLPNSDDVLVSPRNGSIQVWNLKSRRCTRQFAESLGQHRVVALTADSKTAVVGDADGAITAWDLQTGTRRKTWPAHVSSVLDIACSPDNSLAVSVGWDGAMRSWEL